MWCRSFKREILKVIAVDSEWNCVGSRWLQRVKFWCDSKFCGDRLSISSHWISGDLMRKVNFLLFSLNYFRRMWLERFCTTHKIERIFVERIGCVVSVTKFASHHWSEFSIVISSFSSWRLVVDLGRDPHSRRGSSQAIYKGVIGETTPCKKREYFTV